MPHFPTIHRLHLLCPMSRYAFRTIGLFRPSFASLMLPSSHFLAPSQTSHANNIDDSVASFSRLLGMLPPPSIIKINKILGSIAKTKYYRIDISSFAQAEFEGFIPNLFILSILLSNCYCHVGQMNSAFSILGMILKIGPRPDTVGLDTLLKGLCISNKAGEVPDFYDDLPAKGFQVEEFSYGTLINGLIKLENLTTGFCKIKMVDVAIDLSLMVCANHGERKMCEILFM